MSEQRAERKPPAPPQKTNEQRIADLELQLAQTRAGLPGGTLPEHSAGPGMDVEETWSQAEQTAAQAGEYD